MQTPSFSPFSPSFHFRFEIVLPPFISPPLSIFSDDHFLFSLKSASEILKFFPSSPLEHQEAEFASVPVFVFSFLSQPPQSRGFFFSIQERFLLSFSLYSPPPPSLFAVAPAAHDNWRVFRPPLFFLRKKESRSPKQPDGTLSSLLSSLPQSTGHFTFRNVSPVSSSPERVKNAHLSVPPSLFSSSPADTDGAKNLFPPNGAKVHQPSQQRE